MPDSKSRWYILDALVESGVFDETVFKDSLGNEFGKEFEKEEWG